MAQDLGDRRFLQTHDREVAIAGFEDQRRRSPSRVGGVKGNLAQRGCDQRGDVHRQPIDGDGIARAEREKTDPAWRPGQNNRGGTICAAGGQAIVARILANP